RIPPATPPTWQFPLLPLQASNLLFLAGLLLNQLAIGWAAATVLAMLPERWRVGWRMPGRRGLPGVAWIAPPASALMWLRWPATLPLHAWVGAVAAAVVFGLVAISIRRRYRRTTQARRLLLLFAALLIP